jgi:hypothetical protein
MADSDAALEQLTAALQRADLQGFERGQATAKAELAGLDPAGLVCGAFADAMEATASRYVQIDAGFADRLRAYAEKLRTLAAPAKVIAYDPRGGAVVTPDTDIVQATFDQDMDPGKVSLEVKAVSGGAALKGDQTYDHGSRTVSLRLVNGLTAGVSYRATVDGASSEGAALADAFSWEFSAAEAA